MKHIVIGCYIIALGFVLGGCAGWAWGARSDRAVADEMAARGETVDFLPAESFFCAALGSIAGTIAGISASVCYVTAAMRRAGRCPCLPLPPDPPAPE